MTEYLIKEEELIRDAAKEEDEVERMQNDRAKHTGEINSLQRRLKHAKKEQKDEATAFEQHLWKLRQELRDGEKTWSDKEKKFSMEAVQMTTELQKLKAELTDQRTENKRLCTELTKKNDGMMELQAQLGWVKIEAQVQLKQLQQQKEVIVMNREGERERERERGREIDDKKSILCEENI